MTKKRVGDCTKLIKKENKEIITQNMLNINVQLHKRLWNHHPSSKTTMHNNSTGILSPKYWK